MRLILTTLVALSLGGTAGAARADLADERDINAGLLTVAIAEKIQRECDGIAPRFFKARAYAAQLKSMARDRGYSDAEIDAYVNDDAEKAKMRERRNAYYKSKGASNLDPASLCRLGREEIETQSRIGAFLRAK